MYLFFWPFDANSLLLERRMQYLCYTKVIYNIGTEILMLQCDLHNLTQEAPTELSFSAKKSWDRDQKNEIGPSAVVTTWEKMDFSFRSLKNMDFCRRRHNKLKLLRSKSQWYMMIRPFISMKSICWCVFWWSHALKTINLMSFYRFT